jgi:hypothetical protein
MLLLVVCPDSTEPPYWILLCMWPCNDYVPVFVSCLSRQYGANILDLVMHVAVHDYVPVFVSCLSRQYGATILDLVMHVAVHDYVPVFN